MKMILKKGGFTLIEVLVVIVIVGVISSILVVNWRNNEKQYQVQLAAQKIVQDIRRTQEMSLSVKKYELWWGLFKPIDFGVYFTTSARNSYIIFIDNELLDDKMRSWPPIIDLDIEPSISVLENIEIDSLYTNGTSRSQIHLTFSIPDGFTTIKDGSWLFPSSDRNSATIRIRTIGGTCPRYCKDIIVNRTGQVSVQ